MRTPRELPIMLAGLALVFLGACSAYYPPASRPALAVPSRPSRPIPCGRLDPLSSTLPPGVFRTYTKQVTECWDASGSASAFND